jgi:PAS domain S-box-containing protein
MSGASTLRQSLLAALVMALTVAVCILVWWQLERSQVRLQQMVLAQAEQRNVQLADAMAGQVAGLIGTIDLALRQLRREWRGDARGFDETARGALATLPAGAVTHLSVVGADGHVLYNSLDLPPGVYVGDREHFRVHLAGGDRLHIGKPVLSRLGGQWAFIVNRPLLRDGAFAGTVNMLVSSAYVSEKLAGLALSEQDLIGLLHSDGSYLARSRDYLEAMGRAVPASRPFLAPDAPAQGVVRTTGALDDVARIYAWRRLPEYGLITAIGLAERGVLAPLAASMRSDRILALGVSVLVAVFGGFVAWLLLRAGRAQAVIYASEASLREAQRIAHMGSWQYDLRDHRVTWSPEVYRIHEVDAAVYRPSYEGFLAFIHPDDRDRVDRAYRDSVRLQQPYEIEYRLLLRDGRVKHLRAKGETEYRNGRPIRTVGMVQDVTELTAAEQALREQESLLAEAQRVAHLGNWNLDLTTGRAIWSEEEYRLLGYAPNAVEASMDHFMRAVHPDDRDAVAAAMRQAMDADTQRPYFVEHRVSSADGERILEQRGHVVFDDQGRAVRMFGTTMDVTERKRAEQALKQLNEELEARVARRTAELVHAKEEAERASRAKSEFLSRMSHELRTPLNAILGFGQLLDLSRLDAEQRDNVHEILRAGQHLLDLIHEVLDLARIEAGRLEISVEPVAVAAVMQECLTLIRPLAEARAIHLGDVRGTADAHVLADRVRLKQVLLNLLSNAVKYNREGGDIGVAWWPMEDVVYIEVSDTGAGLTDTQRTAVFVPFERLDADSHAIEGTGIGLALSKRLIDLMHGEIGVDSRRGVGSTFWLRLPAVESPAETAEVGRHALPAASSPAGTDAPRRVLCIEDNPANLRLLERILKQRGGIELLTAAAPGLGLELARAHRPALILLDINLPDMDGYAVLERLRAAPETCAIPVIAISANAMPKDVARGQAAGFAAYLTKPLQIAELLRQVDATLARTGDDADR